MQLSRPRSKAFLRRPKCPRSLRLGRCSWRSTTMAWRWAYHQGVDGEQSVSTSGPTFVNGGVRRLRAFRRSGCTPASWPLSADRPKVAIPPNCLVHGRRQLRQLNVDSGPSENALGDGSARECLSVRGADARGAALTFPALPFSRRNRRNGVTLRVSGDKRRNLLRPHWRSGARPMYPRVSRGAPLQCANLSRG